VQLGLRGSIEVIESCQEYSKGVWSCWAGWAGQAGPKKNRITLMYCYLLYIFCDFFITTKNCKHGKQTSETEMNLGTSVTEMSHHVMPLVLHEPLGPVKLTWGRNSQIKGYGGSWGVEEDCEIHLFSPTEILDFIMQSCISSSNSQDQIYKTKMVQ